MQGAGVPDIISRATALFRRARETAGAPGRKAAGAISDAVLKAKAIAGDAWKAMGEGANDLLADVRKHVFAPLLGLGLLYLVTR